MLSEAKVLLVVAFQRQFLLTYPRGAYTTARTVNGNCVFDYTFHVRRLCESVRLMLVENARLNNIEHACAEGNEPIPVGDIRALLDETRMRELVTAALCTGLKRFRELRPALEFASAEYTARDTSHAHVGECKLTLLLCWAGDSRDAKGECRLYTHIAPLPPIPMPPVKVYAFGQPRSNPNAKDSQWVRDRAELEKKKPADVNEVLLVDGHGAVEEGMSSNFFAVMGGTVYTADEGVLKGTVRELALLSCSALGIPVNMTPPSVADARKWDSAFITSTSRLVLPIDELSLFRDDNHDEVQETITFSNHVVADRIRKQVLREMKTFSEEIISAF